jgi:hypothetical protein
MHCLSRAGALENALGSFNEESRFRPSRFFHQIVATAKRHRIRVIALDNVGHLFTGNENIRTDVTQFVNACTRLALQIDGAVILLAHPAKFMESTYSGSTAWENAVRARWYLERLQSEPPDLRDRRKLTLGKANNAAIGATIDMAWHEGAFVPLEDVTLAPGDLDGPMFRSANAKFLECLDICNSQQRHVSDKSRASNYAPKIFEAMPAGRGLRKAEYAAAMERLLAHGLIKLGAEMPWEDSARRRVSGIASDLKDQKRQGKHCTRSNKLAKQPIENKCTRFFAQCLHTVHTVPASPWNHEHMVACSLHVQAPHTPGERYAHPTAGGAAVRAAARNNAPCP